MSELLSGEQVRAALPAGGPWRHASDRLVAELTFASFPEAFAFLTHVALLAEKADHHPEMFSSYRMVRLELISHDAGGVTQRDLDLARSVAALAGAQRGAESAGGKNS